MFELSPVLLESFKVLYVVKKGYKIDRKDWVFGPYCTEPDVIKLQHKSTKYICWIRRVQLGQLCGYVEVPKNHIMFQWDASESMPPADPSHGGVTFSDFLSGRKKKKKWAVGFDCAHYQDFMPKLEADLREAHRITEMCMKPSEFINIGGKVRNYKTVGYVAGNLNDLAGWCEHVDKVSKWTEERLEERRCKFIAPHIRRKRWLEDVPMKIKMWDIN